MNCRSTELTKKFLTYRSLGVFVLVFFASSNSFTMDKTSSPVDTPVTRIADLLRSPSTVDTQYSRPRKSPSDHRRSQVRDVETQEPKTKYETTRDREVKHHKDWPIAEGRTDEGRDRVSNPAPLSAGGPSHPKERGVSPLRET